MSRLNFTAELSDECGAMLPGDIDFEGAHRRVFNRWLAAERYQDLVRYLVQEYDGENGGEQWFSLLADELIKRNRLDLLRALYRPVVELRCKCYFDKRERLRSQWRLLKPVIPLLAKIDPAHRRLEEYRRAVLELLADYRRAIGAISAPEVSAIDRQIDAFARGERWTPTSIHARKKGLDPKSFWRIILRARSPDRIGGFDIERISSAVAEFEAADIQAFQQILEELLDRSYRWDLWAVAYAVRQGCGDDEFDYFRAWLIGQGRDEYEAALSAPLDWALKYQFSDDPQCEALLRVAPEAYRTRTGRELPRRAAEKPSQPAGKRWSEEFFERDFPLLANRFGVTSPRDRV